MEPDPAERAGKPGQVADRSHAPLGLGPESGFRVREEPGQRANVLVVVADDLGERPGGSSAQELEVASGDLRAVEVATAMEAEELGLDGLEPGVGQSVAEDAPDERQQVEVAGVGRWGTPVHPVAADEERPVEAPAVVGDEPGVGRDGGGEGIEQGRLGRVIRQEQLDLAEPVAGPGSEPD